MTWYYFFVFCFFQNCLPNLDTDFSFACLFFLCIQAYKETQEEIWLEYAVSCFLQGIKFGISNSRSHLARVLYLLSFDTPNESVGRAFDKYLEQIPHWVWLSWIPQLLLSLQRTEAVHCKQVLLKVATVYPQVNACCYILSLCFTKESNSSHLNFRLCIIGCAHICLNGVM